MDQRPLFLGHRVLNCCNKCVNPFYSGREAHVIYKLCAGGIAYCCGFFSPHRWWQFRRRPSHHPFGKARICIQLRASTDVSACMQSSGPAAHPPEQNCCGWRGNLFNGSRNCAPTCSGGHNLIKLKRLLLNWYTLPLSFFLISTKWELIAAQLLTFFWPSPADLLGLLPLPKRRERNLNRHWSTAEWLRYLLTQPTVYWSHADQQN